MTVQMKCSCFLLVLRSDPSPQGLPPLTRASMNLQVSEPPHRLGTLPRPSPPSLTPNHPIHRRMRLTFTCFHSSILTLYTHILSLTTPSYAIHALEPRPLQKASTVTPDPLLVFFSFHDFPLTPSVSYTILFFLVQSTQQCGSKSSWRIRYETLISH